MPHPPPLPLCSFWPPQVCLVCHAPMRRHPMALSWVFSPLPAHFCFCYVFSPGFYWPNTLWNIRHRPVAAIFPTLWGLFFPLLVSLLRMGESSIDTNLALLTSSPVMLSGAKLSGDMPLLLGSHGKLSMSQKVVPSSSHGSSIDEEEEAGKRKKRRCEQSKSRTLTRSEATSEI